MKSSSPCPKIFPGTQEIYWHWFTKSTGQDTKLFVVKKQKDTTPPGIKSQIQVNSRLLVRLDKELNQLLDRIEKKKKQKKEFKAELTRLESTLEELRSEQSNFTRWQQGNPGVCQAVATGRVIPGTIIKAGGVN